MQVLWVENLGEVQVALMLAETHAEWLKRMDGQLLFEYDSNPKSDNDGSAADELYMATLFERLMSDWLEKDRVIETVPAIKTDEKASLVVLRVRARENKYWFEALTLADLQLQAQLNTLLDKIGKPISTNHVEKLAAKVLTRKLISRDLYDRICKFATNKNELVANFVNTSLPYNELEPMVGISDGLIRELSQVPPPPPKTDAEKI